MTRDELIEALQKIPSNLEVHLRNGDEVFVIVGAERLNYAPIIELEWDLAE